MGIRGPLPELVKSPAGRLTDLSPPHHLAPAAKDFWVRHADYLDRNNLLTEATAAAFAHTCELYVIAQADLAAGRSSTTRLLLSWLKMFRLVPLEKAGRPADRFHDKPEFEDCDEF